MTLERNDYYRGDGRSLHDECERCMNFHVTLILTDGKMVDGIIDRVEPDRVIMLVGEDVMGPDGGDDPPDQERQYDQQLQYDQQRQFHGHMGHMHHRRRFRRFRRRAFPFGTLGGISLFPGPFFPFFPFL
jgi:hypothetical protein